MNQQRLGQMRVSAVNTIDLPGNPTVLFAHHVNKFSIQQGNSQNQSAARGSSALTDGVRWQANFSKLSQSDKDLAVFKITKSNFTAIPEEIYVKRDPDGFLERHFSRIDKKQPEDMVADIFSGKIA